MTHSVEHQTLDFGSAHDLGVLRSSPMWSSAVRMGPSSWAPLPAYVLSHSLTLK